MRWRMSASRISLASLPSFYKNYQNWWKFDKVLTKINLHSFLRHGVLYWINRTLCSYSEHLLISYVIWFQNGNSVLLT